MLRRVVSVVQARTARLRRRFLRRAQIALERRAHGNDQDAWQERRAATARRPATGARAPRPTSAPLADTGVPSPYALAEVIARRHIDWDSVGNRQALLEDIFQTPYSDLFDPANGSPLYIGQTHKADGTVVRGRPKFARKSKDAISSVDLEGVRNLAQLAERLGATRLARRSGPERVRHDLRRSRRARRNPRST